MITVEVGEQKVVFVPRSCQSYIDKVDYIKMRRPSPYESLSGLEAMSEEGKKKMAEIAIRTYMTLSSVSFDEEITFDCTFEGFYFSVWQSAKESIAGWNKVKPIAGVNLARIWFDALDSDKAEEVRNAIRGIDQRPLAKNSDGPQET